MEGKFAKKRASELWKYRGTKGHGDSNEETWLGLKSNRRTEYYNPRGFGALEIVYTNPLVLQWDEM